MMFFQKASISKHTPSEMTLNSEGLGINLYLPEHMVQRIKDWSVQSNIDVLRKRLDKTVLLKLLFLVKENAILLNYQMLMILLVQKEMIGKTAQLEIKLVENRFHQKMIYWMIMMGYCLKV